MIGTCEAMDRIKRLIEKIGPTDASVLVLGESGTGKELVAQRLHAASGRSPLITVNCASLNDNLLESEMFGHEAGAFSGAVRVHRGYFERADKGTLFLDEVGDMSPMMQAKVLRAVELGEFSRVGSERVQRSQVRIIAATNRALRGSPTFREDLFHRLNEITIELPPLRARGSDVIWLTQEFLGARTMDEAAWRAVTSYPWPGNVRELLQTIRRACWLADGTITSADLQLPAGDLVQPQLVKDERARIVQALERCGWSQAGTAKDLMISSRALNYKISKYGITHPNWKKNR